LYLTARDESATAADRHCIDIVGEWLACDLSTSGNFAYLYRDVQPEVVFNLAGYGIDPTERDTNLAAVLNVELVREIVEAVLSRPQSHSSDLQLVHVGTAAEYGPVDGPVTESSPTVPVTVYGRTKLEGTNVLVEACQKHGLAAVSARLFTVYGPGEHATRLLPSLLAAAHTGEFLALTRGVQRRDFTFVADVAEGLLRLGQRHSAPAIINLATGRLTTVRKFVKTAAQLLHLRPEQLQFGALPDRPDEIRQGPVDTRLQREVLEWVPACSVAEGIRRTISFSAAQGVTSADSAAPGGISP
jgi:nucleoside-diphosphate-sugar epimerase